jgi:hypothetical protein
MPTVAELIDYLQQLDPSTAVVQSEEDFTDEGNVVVLDYLFTELEN